VRWMTWQAISLLGRTKYAQTSSTHILSPRLLRYIGPWVEDEARARQAKVFHEDAAGGVIEIKHSTDIGFPPLPPYAPRVCMSIHREVELCSDIGRVLDRNDPPARLRGMWATGRRCPHRTTSPHILRPG